MLVGHPRTDGVERFRTEHWQGIPEGTILMLPDIRCGRHLPLVLLLALAGFGAASCPRPPLKDTPVNPAADGRYDSEFPREYTASYLERIGESVKMLSSIAYYRVTPFDQKDRIERTALTDELLRSREDQAFFINRTSSGTATVLSYAEKRVVVLTCAHVISFVDTLLTFYLRDDGRPSPHLKSIAVREKQSHYIAVFPERGDLEVLAVDRAADVALLGKRFSMDMPMAIPIFPYRFGSARDLEWGTFVYVFGYPSGHRMITHGIVSSPRKDRSGTFLVDTGSSRGFSGGITVALRDGVPNFELVGMIKLVSARTSNVLVPDSRDATVEYDPALPYTGEVFVERRTEMEQGITQAISAEAIREFIVDHAEHLRRQGYRLDPGWLQPDGE